METTQSRYEEFLKIQTLPEVLTHHLGRHDDLPALTQYISAEKSWKTLTYRELYERVQRWRRSFVKLNLEAGSRVAKMISTMYRSIFSSMYTSLTTSRAFTMASGVTTFDALGNLAPSMF